MNILDIANCIIEFIRLEVSRAQSQGVVLGLSGGIDSSVAVSLATKALGNNRVLGLILPDRNVSEQKDIDDAVELSKQLGIKYHIIDITEIKQKYLDLLPLEKKSIGNLVARMRMTLIYYYANLFNKLVLGTSDKSEMMIGYFTKFGDGAADLLPLADLYKTEVRELGIYLNVPKTILLKKSTPSLWLNQTAEKEIGLEYKKIDAILKYLDENNSARTEKDLLKKGCNKKDVVFVKDRLLKNIHKRISPKICVISSNNS
ncbi:MAG TPA: NAD+ synthase [Nitrososphaeraceae archaeon]